MSRFPSFQESIINSFRAGLPCDYCGETDSRTIRYHQRTMYNYDGEIGGANDINYIQLCPLCKQENDEYWDGKWDDYYTTRL